MPNKAFFLDRDGVINVDHGYVSTPQDFEFIPGVFEACQHIQAAGYLIVIVTNQAGIGRGYYTESDFLALTDWMVKQFAGQGVNIASVEYCPHHPTEGKGSYKKACSCRKPEPGMLLKACEEQNIDAAASVMVGDKPSDMEAGRRAGIGACYSIAGDYEFGETHTGIQCTDLLDAVQRHIRNI